MARGGRRHISRDSLLGSTGDTASETVSRRVTLPQALLEEGIDQLPAGGDGPGWVGVNVLHGQCGRGFDGAIPDLFPE